MGILGFFRLTWMTFLERTSHNDDISTFHFKPSRPLKHAAGQHGIFFLPRLSGVHIFSLSTSPTEPHDGFSTHTGTGSRYKNRLLALKPGEKMLMMGPVLNFTFQPRVKKYVFLAQGIGITPFRSMLVYGRAAKLDVHMTLIHVDSKGHTFKDETSKLADIAYYPTDPEGFSAQVAEAAKDSEAVFYLSGSPRFVRLTRKTLRGLGVSRRRTRADTFLGY